MSDTGMLWFDNDRKVPMAERISKALAYYRRKYGEPDLVLVNPADLPAEHTLGLALRSSRSIMPGHMWIGVEDGTPQEPAA